MRGLCWINGFPLARYDISCPILTTYVPAALLKKGENTIEILEFDCADLPAIESVDAPIGNIRGKIQKM